MKKRLLLFLMMLVCLAGMTELRSQDRTIREEVNYIDSVLKENPYHESFLGITYHYSIDVTPASELVVYMDFEGPFKTTIKANLHDLINPFIIDTASEWTSSVCWFCKKDSAGKEMKCIYQENLYKEGDIEAVESEEICIGLTTKSDVRRDLIKAFKRLVKIVLEQQ